MQGYDPFRQHRSHVERIEKPNQTENAEANGDVDEDFANVCFLFLLFAVKCRGPIIFPEGWSGFTSHPFPLPAHSARQKLSKISPPPQPLILHRQPRSPLATSCFRLVAADVGLTERVGGASGEAVTGATVCDSERVCCVGQQQCLWSGSPVRTLIGFHHDARMHYLGFTCPCLLTFGCGKTHQLQRTKRTTRLNETLFKLICVTIYFLESLYFNAPSFCFLSQDEKKMTMGRKLPRKGFLSSVRSRGTCSAPASSDWPHCEASQGDILQNCCNGPNRSCEFQRHDGK